MTKLLGNCFILLGSISMLIATIGLWRLPKLYMKMHAATKAGTLGCGLILLGVALQIDNIHGIAELILLIFFIATTSPISAQLIGKIAYQRQQSQKKLSK